MRVVLLITDLELGGTPLRIARLARALRELDVDAQVGCLAARGPVSAQLDAAGVPNFACGARRAWHIGALWTLRRELRARRPDLIHSTLTHANMAARLVGGLLGIPVVGSTATMEVERRWHVRLERATARRDAAHIVHSPALAGHVQKTFGVRRERIHVVPPSVSVGAPIDRNDARLRLGLPREAIVIAWAGRFDPVKRVEILIECAAAMPDDNVIFALAGDGPLRSTLEEQARRRGVGQRVRFLGWQADLTSLLSAADIFALPSRTEGLPNALLEAVAMGIPSVATRMPALDDLAANGERLLLVTEAGVEHWVAAICRLINEPALRTELGAAGRTWAAAHLDPLATARAALAVYELVLAARRPT